MENQKLKKGETKMIKVDLNSLKDFLLELEELQLIEFDSDLKEKVEKLELNADFFDKFNLEKDFSKLDDVKDVFSLVKFKEEVKNILEKRLLFLGSLLVFSYPTTNNQEKIYLETERLKNFAFFIEDFKTQVKVDFKKILYKWEGMLLVPYSKLYEDLTHFVNLLFVNLDNAKYDNSDKDLQELRERLLICGLVLACFNSADFQVLVE